MSIDGIIHLFASAACLAGAATLIFQTLTIRAQQRTIEAAEALDEMREHEIGQLYLASVRERAENDQLYNRNARLMREAAILHAKLAHFHTTRDPKTGKFAKAAA